jgi:Retroviral aspartyl protease
MIYTYDYDLNYVPAMPMVKIYIGKPDSAASLTLLALVDSGADATMLPIRHLKQVNAIKRQHVFIRSVSGKRAGANLYTISLQFAHYERHRIDVVGNQDTDEVIIGRDILNHLVVTLDGLANAVLVEK